MEEERRKVRVAIEEAAVAMLKQHIQDEDARIAREESRARGTKWHVGKEIPLAMIGTLLLQTAFIVWWAASVTAQTDANRQALAAFAITQNSVDKRQDDDARRSEDRILAQITAVSTKLDTLMERRAK